MKIILKLYISIALSIVATQVSNAQPARVFGASGFQLDNQTVPIKTILLQAPKALTFTYSLTLPTAPPSSLINVLFSDANGQMSWTSQLPLPSLAKGNIWIGDASNTAIPYAPSGPGMVFTLDNTNTPVWSSQIPLNTTMSVSQLTSGILQNGVVIEAGPGSTITTQGGIITANGLSGAGIGNYSASIPIPQDALDLTINYLPITAQSTVLVSIRDVSLPGIAPFVENITPGAGFKVTFSAQYPTATGWLSYTVINP